jgi:hypothetical protein
MAAEGIAHASFWDLVLRPMLQRLNLGSLSIKRIALVVMAKPLEAPKAQTSSGRRWFYTMKKVRESEQW